MTVDAVEISDPLSRFRILDTDSPDDFRHALQTQFGVRRVELGDVSGFRAWTSLARGNDMDVLSGYCSTQVSLDIPVVDRIRLVSKPAGQGMALIRRRELPIDQQRSVICPADLECRIVDQGRLLVLRIKPEALTRRFVALAGAAPRGRLDLETSVANDDPAMKILLGCMDLLAHEMNNFERPAGSILSGLEQLILSAFVRVSQAGRELQDAPARVSDAQVRRAAEYIDANLDHVITIEELAAATNVSARSLFRAFRSMHGCSPMVFAKQRRLARARDLLLSADATTVTDIALRCGFTNLGHFANDYEALFGELPSRPLLRGRARR